jgi:hypothetical protein
MGCVGGRGVDRHDPGGCGVLAAPGQLAARPDRAASRLLPDLGPVGPRPAFLCKEEEPAVKHQDACRGRGAIVLRIDTVIGNAGDGPLVVAAVGKRKDRPRDCHHDGRRDIDGDGKPDDNDVIVRQRIYLGQNGDQVLQRWCKRKTRSRKVGCRYYHPVHNHYHLAAFADFDLRSVETGQVVRSSGKVSFCISDTDPFDLSLPGLSSRSPGTATTGSGAARSGPRPRASRSAGPTPMGTRHRDRSSMSGGCPPGEYCVISAVDPENRIVESNAENNTESVLYHVDPRQAPRNHVLALAPDPGGCPA